MLSRLSASPSSMKRSFLASPTPSSRATCRATERGVVMLSKKKSPRSRHTSEHRFHERAIGRRLRAHVIVHADWRPEPSRAP